MTAQLVATAAVTGQDLPGELEPFVLGFGDATDEAFGVNNERRHGPSERWCQECGGRYRTVACPCSAEGAA